MEAYMPLGRMQYPVVHTLVPELLLLPVLEAEPAVQGNNAFAFQGRLNHPGPLCEGPIHTQGRREVPYRCRISRQPSVFVIGQLDSTLGANCLQASSIK